MRIGFFSDNYLPRIDGIAFSIESFRLELEQQGHQVFIIAPKPTMRHKDTNPHVIRFPAIKGLFFDDYMTSFFFPPQRIRQIQKLNLDIVHFHTPGQIGLFGAYVAIRTGIPLVTTYHTDLHEYVRHYPKVLPGSIALSMLAPLITNGGMQDYRTGLSSIRPERNIDAWNQKIVERSTTMLHNSCDTVIVPSQKIKDQLLSWKTTSPIVILPTGVDKITTKLSKTASFAKEFGLSSTDEVILFVGRVGTEKNLSILIEAFKIVSKHRKSAKLLIVGTGEDIEHFRTMAAAQPHGDRIIFAGLIPRDQLGAVYALGTVFAFPSVADTQGLVLSEAAWAGLPIVMTDHGISPAAVAGQNTIFAKNNAKDFATKLTSVLKDKAKRTAMAEASVRLAAQYTVARQTEALINTYEQTIAAHRNK